MTAHACRLLARVLQAAQRMQRCSAVCQLLGSACRNGCKLQEELAARRVQQVLQDDGSGSATIG